jgi:hypothetical protein
MRKEELGRLLHELPDNHVLVSAARCVRPGEPIPEVVGGELLTPEEMQRILEEVVAQREAAKHPERN